MKKQVPEFKLMLELSPYICLLQVAAKLRVENNCLGPLNTYGPNHVQQIVKEIPE